MYKTSYKIYKNKQFAGYLLGSFHMHLNPSEYSALQIKLAPLIEACDKIYLEAEMPHFTQLHLGTERAILEEVDKKQQQNKLRYLESMNFQKAMLNSSVWIGTKIVFLPWFNYKLLNKFPVTFLILSLITQKFLMLFNFVFNLLTGNKNILAVQKFHQNSGKQLTQMHQDYVNGIAPSLDPLSNQMLMMQQRDINFAEKITKVNSTTIKTNLYVVGANHLTGDNSLVEKLKTAGFTLEEYAI